MCAIRRVGDDVFRQRLLGLQEILSGLAETVVGKVGGYDFVASCFQLAGDGAIAAGRFPDGTVKTFDG